MAPILTAEDVVRRIAAECTYVDDRGGVGIRLSPRPRSCGSTENNSGRRGRPRRPRSPKPPPLL